MHRIRCGLTQFFLQIYRDTRREYDQAKGERNAKKQEYDEATAKDEPLKQQMKKAQEAANKIEKMQTERVIKRWILWSIYLKNNAVNRHLFRLVLALEEEKESLESHLSGILEKKNSSRKDKQYVNFVPDEIYLLPNLVDFDESL